MLGPWIATATGYGAVLKTIPVIGPLYDTAAGLAALLAGAVLLGIFLGLSALFGYL